VQRASVKLTLTYSQLADNYSHCEGSTLTYIQFTNVGRDSVVGTATRYGLDGPGIEYQWGEGETCPGAHPASCTLGSRSFPGVMRPGLGVDHPPQPSAEVKERIEL